MSRCITVPVVRTRTRSTASGGDLVRPTNGVARDDLALATRTAVASSPGKVILLGEHAVVFGRLAIAGAIDRRLTVRVRSGRRTARQPGDLVAAALDCTGTALGIDTTRLVAEVEGELPRSLGLGSSAALSLAMVRAVAAAAGRKLSDASTAAAAFEVEKLFHQTPSGIDHTAAARRALIAFRGGAFRCITTAEPLQIVVGLGAAPRATHAAIAAVRARRKRNEPQVDSLFDAIDTLATDAERALAAGDLTTLGRLMDANHEVLRALGVSTPELDAMVGLARRRGALGAKLTGGGGGGAMICVPDDDGPALARVFLRAGWRAFVTRVGA